MKRLLPGVLLLAMTAPAQAHFLFLLPGDGKTQPVRAVFSDTLGPDQPELLDRLAHAKFTATDASGKVQTATAKKTKDALNLSFHAGSPALVDATCPYGVVARGKADPFLLHYAARTVANRSSRDPLPVGLLAKGAKDAPLAIVDVLVGTGTPGARVLWHGKPLAGAEVVLYVPGKDEPVTTKTDAQGRVKLPTPTRDGLYGIRARHVVEKAGTHDGKDYRNARYYATFTFASGSAAKTATRAVRAVRAEKAEKPAEDPKATQLLADARAARANWEKFPGFTADVRLNVDGVIVPGKLDVSADGKVELEMKGEFVVWARRFLSSVVGHRLDDGTTLKTPCAFLDLAPQHPLGRGIRVLNDEFHSSYRIRDRQVIEVNRVTGPVRFTISVLENKLTPEKKFLPVSYVVNTWDVKTGALRSSVSHHHTWERVSGFDLPKSMLVLSAADGKQIVRQVDLSGWKLK